MQQRQQKLEKFTSVEIDAGTCDDLDIGDDQKAEEKVWPKHACDNEKAFDEKSLNFKSGERSTAYLTMMWDWPKKMFG